MIKVGSDFSGVGAFNQALIRIGIDYEEIFACDMDKYARQTFCLNYGTENDLMLSKLDTLGKTTISAKDYSFYYPKNVYEREIPKESLDIYMTSPPCQSFSLAGKRMGKEDKRGVLFFNSLEFIQENKPRYFIFENVKGLLSHDKVDKTAEYGRTFQEWSNYLGGKSVNGVHTFFPYEDSVPYHIYFQVLNAKHYGIPQNRERIFIIGIRDDEDNNFQFPKPFPLTKRLKDVLESEVDEKYFLSDKMVNVLAHHQNKIIKNETPEESGCIHAGYFKMGGRDQQYVKDAKIGAIRGRNPTDVVKVAKVGRSDEGKRLRKESLNRGKDYTPFQAKEITFEESDIMNCVTTATTKDNLIQTLEVNKSGLSNSLTTVQKDNVVIYDLTNDFSENETREYENYSPSLRSSRSGLATNYSQRIRRLTPTEAFRLMDFNNDFIEKTLNYKKNLYFQFVYSKFDINKKETLCNAKLKIVKDTQTPKNLETYVLCTTKECLKMDALTTLKQKSVQKEGKNDNLLNVNFAIELLEKKELKECATNIIKWTDCTETLYMLMRKGKNQVVKDILEIQKDKSCIEKSLKITLEENLSEEKLFTTLILLKQIMTSKIYTYVKMPLNTQRFISSTVVYEKKSERLSLSCLKMEYTEQVVSDSMLYKQAGNSICVGVLAAIIEKINL